MTVQSILEEIRHRPGTGEVIPIINPATEEQITEFRDGGAVAVEEAVAAARASVDAGTWCGLPGNERAKSCGALPI